MNEVRRENNKGITLIALIIIVVILLILTAVTVDIVISNDYFSKAQGTIGEANEQINNQKDQENEIKTNWEDLPGKIIKSPTKKNTTIKISVKTSNITRNSFRINAKGTNKNNDTLTFTLTVEGHEQVFEAKTGEEVYWDVTGLNQNTTYQFTVTATDGETENSVTGSEKTSQNNPPVIISNEIDEKTTNSFTIKMCATDEDGDGLVYKLYYVPGPLYFNSGWEEAKSVSMNEIEEGTAITLSATELLSFVEYAYYIQVTDGTEIVKSEEYILRTYCPGGDENVEYTMGYCATCDGTGYIVLPACTGTITHTEIRRDNRLPLV